MFEPDREWRLAENEITLREPEQEDERNKADNDKKAFMGQVAKCNIDLKGIRVRFMELSRSRKKRSF